MLFQKCQLREEQNKLGIALKETQVVGEQNGMHDLEIHHGLEKNFLCRSLIVLWKKIEYIQ